MDASAQARVENLIWAAGTVLFIIVGSIALAYVARWVARWRGTSPGEQRKIFWGFLFASPWIIGFVIFVLGPALASLYYSFTDYKLGKDIHWIGLENYRVLLGGEGAYGRRFTQAMFNSFYYMIVGVPLQIITALAMAILLNQPLRGIRIFRLIFYTPVILAGGPAILLAWRYMLASNGGFVNVALGQLAHSFFLFDWLYRGLIFAVEAVNSFYAGIARGDPLGPFKYTIPAVLGVLILITLVRGEWTPSKRGRARQVAEITGVVLIVILAARALIAQPVDVGLVYGMGLVATIASLAAEWQGKSQRGRLWRRIPLAVFGVGLVVMLIWGGEDRGLYVPAIIIAAAPLAATLIARVNRQRMLILGAGATLLVLLIFVRLVPGQLDGGRLSIAPQYLTLNSAIAQPDNLDYLNTGFAESTPTSLWLFGLLAVMLGGLALANNKYPRAQRVVMYGGLAFFGLIAASSVLDGVRYFHTFEQVAAATGSPNYHFALFTNITSTFPDQNRVPLWMASELWSKPSLILITMWSSGTGMLIFLAALKGVPRSLYEAAEVDGANRWQKFWKITLPMISPAMFYNVVIGVIAALQTFDTIYILQNTQTQDSLASAAYFLFVRTFRQLEIGQGAAVSWILAVIIVLLTVLQFRYSNWVHYEA